MEPLPTPYDITELPVFAWSPGLLSWVLLFLLFLCGALILWIAWKKSNAKESTSEVLSQALLAWGTLESMLGKDSPKYVIARASNILRRFLAVKVDTSVTSLGPTELFRLANQKTQKDESSLIQLLARLEEFKFSPGDSKENAKDLLGQGFHELQQWRDLKKEVEA